MYRLTGANLAANVFDILRQDPFRERVEQSPYPRLRALLAALANAETVVDPGDHGIRACGIFQQPGAGTGLRYGSAASSCLAIAVPTGGTR